MPTDMKPGWVLERVISGGQTGVDQVALEVAKHLGYATGGMVPKGWRTDAGSAPWLGTVYGCVEHWSREYGPRTMQNVYDAEATVLYGVLDSSGCRLTRKYIAQFGKLSKENPTAEELRDWIMSNGIKVLNVAGNRQRTHPGSGIVARTRLLEGLLPF